jgi:hypothetical protein
MPARTNAPLTTAAAADTREAMIRYLQGTMEARALARLGVRDPEPEIHAVVPGLPSCRDVDGQSDGVRLAVM